MPPFYRRQARHNTRPTAQATTPIPKAMSYHTMPSAGLSGGMGAVATSGTKWGMNRDARATPNPHQNKAPLRIIECRTSPSVYNTSGSLRYCRKRASGPRRRQRGHPAVHTAPHSHHVSFPVLLPRWATPGPPTLHACYSRTTAMRFACDFPPHHCISASHQMPRSLRARPGEQPRPARARV